MIQRDYLIIGGGIGGASVCQGIRRYDKRGSVTLISAEIFPPYKRWILSTMVDCEEAHEAARTLA